MDVDNGEEGIADDSDKGINKIEAVQDTAPNAITKLTELLSI